MARTASSYKVSLIIPNARLVLGSYCLLGKSLRWPIWVLGGHSCDLITQRTCLNSGTHTYDKHPSPDGEGCSVIRRLEFFELQGHQALWGSLSVYITQCVRRLREIRPPRPRSARAPGAGTCQVSFPNSTPVVDSSIFQPIEASKTKAATSVSAMTK